MTTTITLPALGENIETADVVTVLVEPGQRVTAEQPIVEVETGKASVEIPAPVAGIVREIVVRPGDSIPVGAPIAIVEADAADAPATDAPAAREEAPVPAPPPKPEPAPQPVTFPAPSHAAAAPAPAARLVPAAPSVRRLARQLGVDITTVRGTGPGGRISMDDVKAHARSLIAAVPSAGAAAEPELPDFSRFGEVTVEPVSTIRRLTAEAVDRSWRTVPQVTNHELADITHIEEIRRRHRSAVEAAGGRLSMTAILVKAVAAGLPAHPELNSSIDLANRRIFRKHYVHIGVAVDTEAGLLVPVIRDADTKSITAIAVELADLAARARSRSLRPDELEGATFTISNLGGIGGTGFSPIVSWPQAAILGVLRARTLPRWNGEAFEPRLMLPLSLSYDHRLVDGAQAARFLRWLASALEEPLLLSL